MSSTGESALKERNNLQAQEKAITALEKGIKQSKAELKTLSDELDQKLNLKRFGAEDLKAESPELLREVENQLANLDEVCWSLGLLVPCSKSFSERGKGSAHR
jgi:type I restriction enzyme M protein